jgi:hypothetical protein
MKFRFRIRRCAEISPEPSIPVQTFGIRRKPELNASNFRSLRGVRQEDNHRIEEQKSLLRASRFCNIISRDASAAMRLAELPVSLPERNA